MPRFEPLAAKRERYFCALPPPTLTKFLIDRGTSFQERKGWVPERSHPRRRKKDKKPEMLTSKIVGSRKQEPETNDVGLEQSRSEPVERSIVGAAFDRKARSDGETSGPPSQPSDSGFCPESQESGAAVTRRVAVDDSEAEEADVSLADVRHRRRRQQRFHFICPDFRHLHHLLRQAEGRLLRSRPDLAPGVLLPLREDDLQEQGHLSRVQEKD